MFGEPALEAEPIVSNAEHEAKRFLIDRIAERAIKEGTPLTEHDLNILSYSADEPGPYLVDADGSDDELERRVSGLLERSYLDQATSEERRPYRDAVGILVKGDHYLGWLAHRAGIHPPRPAWLSPFRQVGLFLLLVVPALFGLLMGAAGLWVALGRVPSTTYERVGMSIVALIFTGFGVFLLSLWLRERRA